MVARKLVACTLFIGISLVGLSIGTQWNAREVPQRTRGAVLLRIKGYQLYPPYQGVWWWLTAHEAVADRLLPGVALGFGAVVGGALVARLVGSQRSIQTRERYISGARWATREDVQRGRLL